MNHVERFARTIALLLAVFCLWPVALADGGGSQPVEVQDVTVANNLVLVEVHNSGPDARTVTVTVDAVLTNGLLESGTASVFVDGKASASAFLAFSGEVDEVDSLGMSDDATPF